METITNFSSDRSVIGVPVKLLSVEFFICPFAGWLFVSAGLVLVFAFFVVIFIML